MSETLEALRVRAHELELEAVAIRARHAEVVTLIAILEQLPPRRGRPPGPRVVASSDPTEAA